MNDRVWKIKEITNEEMMNLTNNYEGFTHGTTEYSESKQECRILTVQLTL